MRTKNNNLVKCGIWMAAAFVCMMVIALFSTVKGVYNTASVATLVCMAISMFYWVRFAEPLSRGAFKFK